MLFLWIVGELKKTVYHSNSVLSALSSTWTSKPPLAVRYKLDTDALEMESMEGKSHGSTLERLLAWEKKLYEEVKARESVKIEHGKKLSTLQSLEYRGRDSAKLDKIHLSCWNTFIGLEYIYRANGPAGSVSEAPVMIKPHQILSSFIFCLLCYLQM